MIREDYVSFETAKALKYIGFPQCTREDGYTGWKYNNDGVLTTAPYAEHYAAPSLYYAMKWLRYGYDFDINIFRYIRRKKTRWGTTISKNTHVEYQDWKGIYSSYEDAVNGSIQYICYNLLNKSED